MDIHSTQALLNLARSGNFLPPTSGGSSAFSPPSSLEAAVKKRPATSEALDLSPPTVKKAKIEAKPTSAPPSADPTIINWSVSEVCQFVASIDICKEYTEVSLQFSPFSKKMLIHLVARGQKEHTRFNWMVKLQLLSFSVK